MTSCDDTGRAGGIFEGQKLSSEQHVLIRAISYFNSNTFNRLMRTGYYMYHRVLNLRNFPPTLCSSLSYNYQNKQH